MIRYMQLLRGDSVAVGRFDHPLGHPHEDPAEEFSDAYSINFVESGGFSIEIGRQSWSLCSGSLFLTCPGLAYRCRHSDSSPTDVCLAVEFRADDDTSHELARVFSRSVRRLPVYALNNRIAYLKHGLHSAPRDRLRAETAAHELVFAVLDGAAEHCRHTYRARQLSWYAERVDACRERMDRDYAADLSLASLARSVGMSPFHFARVFSDLSGMPPHRYLLRVRLQTAASRLRQGDTVTNACYASGFQNLSHFTRLFQRHFGVLPSSYRKQ